MPKYAESYKGKNIGRWIQSQRSNNNIGNLSKERKEKLESIGIYFDNIFDKEWNENFNLLKEFIEIFNRLPKSNESYKGKNIGTWHNAQKRTFNTNKLSDERKQKLESIGIHFGNINDIKWNENFKLVKKFIKKVGRLPKQHETYNGKKIGQWCNRQKLNFNNNKLSDDKVEKLELIGLIVTNKDEE